MKMKLALLPLALLPLAACAAPLNTAKLDSLPVVEFGQPIPKAGGYILHFPAGKPIPTDVEIGGNLIARPVHQVLTVKLNQGIYSYKKWVSFDKRHWLPSREVLALKMDIKIPGYKYPHPGHIRLDLSKKN